MALSYSSNLGRWIADPDPRAPHFAAPLDCACLGCRTFGMGGGTGTSTGHVVGSDGKPMAPLPALSKANAFISADNAAKLDRQVLECFAESYLAPLLPMTRSQNWEIRRGAITSIARLSDNQLRAAVSALRNLKGRSVLSDVLGYSMSEMCTMPQRREAGERAAERRHSHSPRRPADLSAASGHRPFLSTHTAPQPLRFHTLSLPSHHFPTLLPSHTTPRTLSNLHSHSFTQPSCSPRFRQSGGPSLHARAAPRRVTASRGSPPAALV